MAGKFKKLMGALITLAFICSSSFAQVPAILTVEIAKTPAEKTWGLSGRVSLPENHGMLFIYNPPEKMHFWMFNTLIDLSIAFIDDQQIIREIHPLKAHPEKMDPTRPVKTIADIDRYDYWSPEKKFFREHSVTSKANTLWALEVNAGWFDRHQIQIGDVVLLNHLNSQLSFIRKGGSTASKKP